MDKKIAKKAFKAGNVADGSLTGEEPWILSKDLITKNTSNNDSNSSASSIQTTMGGNNGMFWKRYKSIQFFMETSSNQEILYQEIATKRGFQTKDKDGNLLRLVQQKKKTGLNAFYLYRSQPVFDGQEPANDNLIDEKDTNALGEELSYRSENETETGMKRDEVINSETNDANGANNETNDAPLGELSLNGSGSGEMTTNGIEEARTENLIDEEDSRRDISSRGDRDGNDSAGEEDDGTKNETSSKRKEDDNLPPLYLYGRLVWIPETRKTTSYVLYSIVQGLDPDSPESGLGYAWKDVYKTIRVPTFQYAAMVYDMEGRLVLKSYQESTFATRPALEVGANVDLSGAALSCFPYFPTGAKIKGTAELLWLIFEIPGVY